MKRGLVVAAGLTLAALIAGTALAQMGPGPRDPMGPGQMSEMAKMMEMMPRMQEQMKGMQGMGPMQGGMGSMMAMMGQMQGMMAQHQETMKRLCPGATGDQTPKPGG